MEKIKKILAFVLTIAMTISVLYVGEPKEVRADAIYMIKVAGSDTYLYANGSTVAAGQLVDNDTGFQWVVLKRSDGSYWIQSQKNGSYMAIENQTGKIELLDTVYDVWQSCKWSFSTAQETNIQNKWLSNYIRVSGEEAIYSNTAQKFEFVAVTSDGTSDSDTREPVVTGGYADTLTIPAANNDINSIGATMPYTRYDSNAATIGGGAVRAVSNDFSKDNLASQASEQSYVRLPKAGAYAEWKMDSTGNGVTMRFTMPDSADGMGLKGSLDVYVNGTKVKTVDLTSYYMWQYFQYPNPYQNGHPDDKLEKAGSTGCFAFDEVHFRLDKSLKKGDTIRIQSSGANGYEYGVDFLEIEETGAAIAKPANAYSVVDYGAVPNDGKNDYYAIYKCINAANAAGKDVYFPAGTFHIDQMWRINASDMKITGAGMWYTNLQFTNANPSGGGISGSKANNVEFCNMYINSNLRSRYNQQAVYKCFMDVWSGGSYIHDVWEDHFECGFWLADYNSGDGLDYCDGIKIANCRIRNNFADGVNFCQGTSNATVYNCNIRNCGDDGLAMWNNNYLGVKDEEYNAFCYNTIDLIWRAGAIAIYGGNGHEVYNNYITDTFMSSGIHVNTSFDGYKFKNNSDGIKFTNNVIIRSGTSSDSWQEDMAALDIAETGGSVRNIIFNNTYIYDAQHDAVRVVGNPTNITFTNLKVYGTGKDGKTTDTGNTGSLFKFTSVPGLTINGLEYADIANEKITYGSRSNCTITNEKNLGSSYVYTIPAGTSAKSNAIGKTNETTESAKGNVTSKVKVKRTKVKKAKRTKNNKKIKITLKKIKGATGYYIKYSTKKKFKKKYTKTVKTKKNVKTIKKLKANKKYYIKARAYKIVNGNKYLGKWSKRKTVKVRK